MTVERTDKEIIIRLSADTDVTGIQDFLDYLRFKEIASKSQASQEEIDKIAREAKASSWEKNKDLFLK